MHYLLKGIALTGLFSLTAWPREAAVDASVPILLRFDGDQLQGETTINQVVIGPGGQIIAAGKRIGFYQNERWEFLPEARIDEVRCLLVDGDTLWVSSTNEIGRMALPLGLKSRYEKLDFAGLETAGTIWYLARRGEALIATSKDEVWFIDLPSKIATKRSFPNSNRIFLHSFEGKLIVAGPGADPRELRRGELVNFESPLSNPKDRNWMGTADSYVVAYEIYRKQGDRYRPILRLETEGDGLLYTSVANWENLLAITTYNKGLILVDPAVPSYRVIAQPSVLPSPGAIHAVADPAGRLWVGTTRGIALLESARFGRVYPTKEFPLSAFRADGLLVNYEARAEYLLPSGEWERRPRAFAQVPTRHGLASGYWAKLKVGDKEFQLPGSSVAIITELPDGGLLATASERLYRVDVASGEIVRLAEPQGEVTGLTVIGDTVWAATVSGELLRSPATGPLAFAKVASLPRSTASSLHRFGETLIVANSETVAFGEGLARVAQTAGLRSPRLAATADGTVWLLGEQNGHWRLGRLIRTATGITWETVEAKGLAQLPGVQHLSAAGGTLAICGGANVLELEAAELRPAYRLAAPSLRFETGDPGSGAPDTRAEAPAELSAESNNLTFSGTLPFDEFGEKPAFERRLLPTDTAWIPTRAGERVAYPSLSPRAYTLEVRATHLGHFGAVARYTFTVLPPWYFSTAALAGYGFGLILIAYLFYRLRTHQIRQRNRELERIVAERTRELAEASAAKSEFVASMSHEIRNPMNGVIGLVNILREQPVLPRQSNHLRLLHACAEQLRATVDDILDFSKIEARRVAVASTAFDLRETLEAAAASVDPAGSAIQFVEPPPAGLGLLGDAAKLRQIFANYLNNALKYGVPPGARVSTILTPADGSIRLTLSVTSTGPTIEKDKLDALFQSFTRGEDAIERNIRGTGLGLAICQRYAQAMGGEVGAVSTNGETTFYLNVPFEKTGAGTVVEVPVPVPKPALPARALAIEDEDYNRIVLGDILAKMNYTVDWATTGAEAIRLAQENGYDIILTDYRLPDTNGVELTKKILQLCPVPKPAVFAVTAYSTRERREECLAAGMAGFISKPITLEKLRATLAGWGDRQLTTISLETYNRSARLPTRPAAIDALWLEVKTLVATDPKRAADQAHRLNNLSRMHGLPDVADQLELLEGALERGEPETQLVAAVERLLRA